MASQKKSKTKQELPKWFKGQLYSQGETVTNPFSGESYDLTAEEVSMYDFIMGAQMMMEQLGWLNPKTRTIQNDMSKGLHWFRVNNPEAYYVLLD